MAGRTLARNARSLPGAILPRSEAPAWAWVICLHTARPAVDTEEYLAGHLRALKEASQRSLPRTGETRPVRMEGDTCHLTRGQIEHSLRTWCPRGLHYMYHTLDMAMVDVGDFEAACDHFGLRGVLEEITYRQVEEEMRARRERGDAPSTGMLPSLMDEIMPREMADARIAIVERRIDEARAGTAAAPAQAAP